LTSRRTFLKTLAGLAAFLLPWTIWPEGWAKKLAAWTARPPVKLQLPADYWDGVSLEPDVLNRKALQDIEFLSQAGLQGRRAGTAGETKALVYLEEQFKALHLKPFGENGKYWQMFSIPAMTEKIINNRALFRPDESDPYLSPSANILAGIPGKDPQRTLILSAHYDHLGVYQGKFYPGANDNASGVGCVLEVMRRLAAEAVQGIKPRSNIVAAFWGAEEMGFLGSKHFVAKPTIPLSDLQAVINYDTVANGNQADFILWPEEDSFLSQKIIEVGKRLGARIEKVHSGGHHSDEFFFVEASVPTATMLSRQWLHKNHTPEDNLALLNREKLQLACDMLYALAKELAY